MPHIVIKLYPGRTEETKAELAAKIRDDVCSVADCEAKSVSVDIQEIPSEKWDQEVYQPEIASRMDQLAVKPGY